MIKRQLTTELLYRRTDEEIFYGKPCAIVFFQFRKKSIAIGQFLILVSRLP
jgi:hypothetical protein